MSYKKKFEKLVKDLNDKFGFSEKDPICYYVSKPVINEGVRTREIEIELPSSWRFEPELHFLVCWGYEDAYIRLSSYEDCIEICKDECCTLEVV